MRRLFSPLVALAIVVLSACGGAPAAAPTAVPAPPTAVPAPPTAAPAPQPTPTFESVTDTEPTVGAAQGSGTLVWRDQILRNDQVVVSVTGLDAPVAGQVYAAWLSGKESSLPLGPLAEAGGGARSVTFIAPLQENLLGQFERVYVTSAAEAEATTDPANVLLSGALPEQALVHIRHVLFSIGNTPNEIGFALGLRQETDELLRHAQFLRDALDAGDLPLEKVHAEHIANIIEGSTAHDLNGDGRIQNPGDGFGLLINGQQDGYIKGMIDHARLAAEAGDATDNIRVHAGHVQIAGENTRARVEQIHALAETIVGAGSADATRQNVLQVLALAQQVIQGVDADGDEQVGPVPGEGGVLTAYQHAQLMANVALAPATGAASPPAPAQQPAPAQAQPDIIAIDIGDNTFEPKKITVPVGSTVVWTHKGQNPHTVTADDASFDSKRLDAGANFRFTFEEAGTFPYFCEFHGGKGGEGMAATIVVANASAAAVHDHGAPAAPPPAPTQAPAAAPPPAGTIAVTIGDNTYEPKEISIPVGGTVVWTHAGQRPHTVTADGGAFESETLQSGATFEQTFDQPGTFPYYCEFHGGPGGQGMAGTITVGGGAGQAAPAPPTTAPPPPPATTAPPPPTTAPAPAAVEVSMLDFEFGTKELRVKAGTTVTWKNDGQQRHSAKAVDGSFDTGLYGSGEARSVRLDTPGTFLYYCELHGAPDGSSGMVATVIVE